MATAADAQKVAGGIGERTICGAFIETRSAMYGYQVAMLNEIEEVDDGRRPYRPVRHCLGITAFGVNGWGPRKAGEQLINDYDEAGPDPQEELYVVSGGRARFEIDGETV